MGEGELKVEAKVSGIDQLRELEDNLQKYLDLIEESKPNQISQLRNMDLLVGSTDTLAKKITQLKDREAQSLKINREQYTLLRSHIAERKNYIRSVEDEIKQKERIIRSRHGRAGTSIEMASEEVTKNLGPERAIMSRMKGELSILRDRIDLAKQGGLDDDGKNPILSGLMGGLGLRQLGTGYLAYRAGAAIAGTPGAYMEEQGQIWHGITSGMNNVSDASKDITQNLGKLADAAIMTRPGVLNLISGMQEQASWTQATSEQLKPLLETLTATGTAKYAPQLAGMAFRSGAITEGMTESYINTLFAAGGAGRPPIALQHMIPFMASYEQSRAMAGYGTNPLRAGLLAKGIWNAGQLYQGDAGMAVQQQIQGAFQGGGARGDASRMFFMRAYGMGTGTSYYDVQKRIESGWTSQNWNDFTKQLNKEYGHGGQDMVNMAGASMLRLTLKQFEDLYGNITQVAKTEGAMSDETLKNMILTAQGKMGERAGQINDMEIKAVNSMTLTVENIKMTVGKVLTETGVDILKHPLSAPLAPALLGWYAGQESLVRPATGKNILQNIQGDIQSETWKIPLMFPQDNLNRELQHNSPESIKGK